MIVSSTYRLTDLHYTFGCATLSAVYICNPSLQNYRVLPYLWLRRLWVKPMFLSSTYKISAEELLSYYPYVFPTLTAAYYRITELHYTKGCATLRHPMFLSFS